MNALQKIDNMMNIIEGAMECDDIKTIKKKILFLGFRLGELAEIIEMERTKP